MLFAILSTIRSLTFQIAGLSAADCRLIAAGVLGLAAENGTVAAPLAVLAAEVDQPADRVLAVLRALADAGLVVLSVPPLAGDVAEAWVVVWWAGFAGIGVTVNVYSVAGQVEHGAAGSGSLFVCSDPSQDQDHKQTNKPRTRTRAREAAPAASADDTGRIVALLTDPAVTAGLIVKSSGAAVGCFRPDQAREIAGVVLRAGGSFSSVLGNVCEWRREVERGAVFSPLPALRSRLTRGFDGSITAGDRALPWFVKHDPAAWLPADDFPAAAGGIVGQDVAPAASSAVAVESSTAPAVDPAWDRVLAALRLQNGQIADLLADASAVPADDGAGRWIVRLGRAGAAWAAWLQAKAARPVAAALASMAGGPVLAVEFQKAPAAGDD